jgi:hypothetical protein
MTGPSTAIGVAGVLRPELGFSVGADPLHPVGLGERVVVWDPSSSRGGRDVDAAFDPVCSAACRSFRLPSMSVVSMSSGSRGAGQQRYGRRGRPLSWPGRPGRGRGCSPRIAVIWGRSG